MMMADLISDFHVIECHLAFRLSLLELLGIEMASELLEGLVLVVELGDVSNHLIPDVALEHEVNPSLSKIGIKDLIKKITNC